jgi:hypothetical protein
MSWRVRISFIRQRLDVQPCALGDRARRSGFEVLAKMIRQNVQKRPKLDLYASDSPRAAF